ncbi:MAG: hypothetical protein Q8J70_12920, partial [Thiobacillus sp.]|nr:hypothetical protein [Thiobacillus sp.]
TPSLRPSDKSSHIMDSSKLRSIAEVFMPCPFYFNLPRFHRLCQFVQFLAGEPLIVRQANGMQPEFCAMPIFSNMHMQGLAGVAFVREKEEVIPLKLKDAWHGSIIARRGLA